MASKLLAKSVTEGEGGTYDFTCPGVQGHPCGTEDKPYTSTGWPTRKAATARGALHFAEHKGDVDPVELEDFRTDQGISTESGRAVKLGDL